LWSTDQVEREERQLYVCENRYGSSRVGAVLIKGGQYPKEGKKDGDMDSEGKEGKR
jgi:hypothetical protein